MLKGKLIVRIFIFCCLLLVTQSLIAQDILKNKDLSQVKVDQLSDNDIIKFKSQLAASGMSIEDAQQVALSKGMSLSEFNKLKARMGSVGTDNSTSGKLKVQDNQNTARSVGSPDSLNKAQYLEAAKRRPLIDSLIFGSELYTAVAPSFEPNLNLATPLNYVLGPTDQISISVFGVQQYEGNLTVSPEGIVVIPSVGEIKVAGLTIEEATQRIKTVMGNTAYPYLKSGASKLSISLSKIRTIRVTVIGSNMPGNYNVSSLATVFNLLFLAGGPTSFGSFREIELIRNGKVFRKIDLYRFLLNGDQSDNIGLKDNDVIRIPAYKTRVQLQGQVKRPGIFEVLPGEHFDQILAFASGFTDTAYRAGIRVYQQTDKERKITDIGTSDYAAYQPNAGDLFVISKLLNRFENRVKISGAVFRPDSYGLTAGLKVADLIRKADGLREDAYLKRGQVLRLQDDLTRSIISFDVVKAMSNDPEHNVPLRREDEVLITSIHELRDVFHVTIQGEIRLPGLYDFVEGLTIRDLILQAGGFTDAALGNIEVSRLIKRDTITMSDTRFSEMTRLYINDARDSSIVANVRLQPYDVVTIRRKAGYEPPVSVTVSGQVQFPGPYSLNSIVERVSDMFKRAGGALPNADMSAAYLRRYLTKEERERDSSAMINSRIKAGSKDSTENEFGGLSHVFDQIPLDLSFILANPGSPEDMVLRADDELVIPKFDGQVKIKGAILSPTQIPYQPLYDVADYLSAAGGYTAKAWKNKVYVVYPNGKAAITKRFLFFKKTPKVTPGSTVVVPSKAEKKSMGTGEIIGLASAIASLAGVVIAILNVN